MENNIIMATDMARAKNSFTSGLASYTQANCQVTISNGLVRIYRTPNIASSSKTQWGGVILRPYNINNTNVLTKTHRYVIKFEVKGFSDSAIGDSLYWSNNAGWTGGGLMPSPSNVTTNGTLFSSSSFNFSDWVTFSYAWTINDDVYKVCTSSYSSFVQGETYLSYKDFKFGFGYTNTGTNGTELYLKNFRMYDITDSIKNPIITKFGIVNPSNFVEDVQTLSLYKDQEIVANEIYED